MQRCNCSTYIFRFQRPVCFGHVICYNCFGMTHRPGSYQLGSCSERVRSNPNGDPQYVDLFVDLIYLMIYFRTHWFCWFFMLCNLKRIDLYWFMLVLTDFIWFDDAFPANRWGQGRPCIMIFCAGKVLGIIPSPPTMYCFLNDSSVRLRQLCSIFTSLGLGGMRGTISPRLRLWDPLVLKLATCFTLGCCRYPHSLEVLNLRLWVEIPLYQEGERSKREHLHRAVGCGTEGQTNMT